MRTKPKLHVAPGDWSRIVVPVSGGKDSQLSMALAVDEVGPERVLGVHQNTGFDHPLTYEHMRYMEDRYGVEIIDVRSAKYESVPDVMLGECMIPSRLARMCTRQLKTGPWFRWLAAQPDRGEMLIYLGMRAAESTNRMDSYGALDPMEVYAMGDLSGECPASCASVRGQLPIVDLTTPSVYQRLRDRGDKINPLYGMGHKRVGCFPCVLGGKATMQITARDPVGRENLGLVGDAIKIIQWARPELADQKFFEHDVDAILAGEHDPFGFMDPEEEQTGGCSWCNL